MKIDFNGVVIEVTIIPGIYSVPKTFYADHLSRKCGDKRQIVDESVRHFIVNLSEDTLVDLLTDAAYYVECGYEMGRESFSLISSARATWNGLLKQIAKKEEAR